MTEIAIISDVHYAGPQERERHDYPYHGIRSPLRRFLTWQFRHWIWQRDPFAHNYLLDRFIEANAGASVVIANGDYSCDSMGVGVSDPPSYESAEICLQKLRQAFGDRFHPVLGDHEIGKLMMSSGRGGLRLASLDRAMNGLRVQPFWRFEIGQTVMIGIASTLAALPVYEVEALPEERAEWRRLHEDHLATIESAFDAVKPGQRVILFCHDPSALPFLWEREGIRKKVTQIERTVIGHLHTNLVFGLSRFLRGMPEVHFLGHTPRRLSRALGKARHWAPFQPLLCPSPSGSQLLKDGGYWTVAIDECGERLPRMCFHRMKW